MNPPRDAEPDPRDPQDPRYARTDRPTDESDPTGVRAMLAALPDPGPMPAGLVHRITASLAAEQARHGAVNPVVDGADSGGDGGTLHSLAVAGARRTSLGRRLPAIAVAASIVVLAGAVMLGVFAMNNGLVMTAGYDTAAESSVSDSGADRSGEAGGAAELFGAEESAPPADDTDQNQSLATASAPMLATGALLTSATLVDHARKMRDGSAPLGPEADAERAMTTSPVGTPEGAADCLSGLLSISPEEASGRIGAIDFVRFDGTPAVLILAHDAPPGTNPPEETGSATAYLVPLDCGPRSTVPLHEPVRIDS